VKTQAPVIVGTAGHIDHGKTSLTRVLTGVDTDRLPEEKERGITIELGFAPLDLPSGRRVGVVDVPGHERFVRTMVAGAAGIDLVLLVIAADEGVMPQTREHLDICRLLGVRGGLVVLSKADLVDDEWLALVTGEVRAFLAGSFLAGSPIIPFSAPGGRGKHDLLAALDEAVGAVQPRASEGAFRLPVDRVFTIKGFGTVVTGTVVSGRVHTGDELRFYPGEVAGKVRGVQVHDAAVEASFAGTRTALNLQGLAKDAVERGQTAAHPGTLLPTYLLDLAVDLLPSAPRALADRARVRADLFTAEALARVVVLAGAEIPPGGKGLVQLRLESPVTALPGDRVILRSWSPAVTIGGGTVLDPFPSKHKKGRKGVAEHLARLSHPDPGGRIEALLAEAGSRGSALVELAVRAGVDAARAGRILAGLARAGLAVAAGGRAGEGGGEGITAWSQAAYRALGEKALSLLAGHHKANPLKTGMNREEMRRRLAPDFPEKAFRLLLDDLAGRGALEVVRDEVRVLSHRASLSPGQDELRGRVLAMAREAHLAAPFLDEMAAALRADAPALKAVLALLAQRGDLARVKDDYFLDPAAHADLLARVDGFFAKKTEMAMSDFRDLTGVTRKWMIPLLEYLDRTGVTLRKGEVRIRRGRMVNP
jgi:selenocysteine-specific elongation factor